MDPQIPTSEPQQQVPVAPPPITPSRSIPRSFIIAVGFLLVVVAGGSYFLGTKQTPKSAERLAVTPTQAVTQNTAPEPTTATSDMSTWKTYSSAYEGASFKYPSDWVLTTKVYSPLEGESVTITSPGGLSVQFTPYVTGLGGGCDPENCPVVKTLSVTPVAGTNSKASLYLVRTSYDANKSVGLMSLLPDNPYVTIPQVGAKKGFPYYVLFANHNGMQAALMLSISDRDQPNFSSMTDEAFFALPEVKTAEKIITSLKYAAM